MSKAPRHPGPSVFRRPHQPPENTTKTNPHKGDIAPGSSRASSRPHGGTNTSAGPPRTQAAFHPSASYQDYHRVGHCGGAADEAALHGAPSRPVAHGSVSASSGHACKLRTLRMLAFDRLVRSGVSLGYAPLGGCARGTDADETGGECRS